jgi:hypothetical protein
MAQFGHLSAPVPDSWRVRAMSFHYSSSLTLDP